MVLDPLDSPDTKSVVQKIAACSKKIIDLSHSIWFSENGLFLSSHRPSGRSRHGDAPVAQPEGGDTQGAALPRRHQQVPRAARGRKHARLGHLQVTSGCPPAHRLFIFHMFCGKLGSPLSPEMVLALLKQTKLRICLAEFQLAVRFVTSVLLSLWGHHTLVPFAWCVLCHCLDVLVTHKANRS